MNSQIGPELMTILEQFKHLEPRTRPDLKEQLTRLLKSRRVVVHDTHNTTAMIFVFTADEVRYGLKIELGDDKEAKVLRDEVKWYRKAQDIAPHYIASHLGKSYAFVVLRWLGHAKTIEEIAIANEGKSTHETMDLIIKALDQNQALFDSNPKTALHNSKQHSFFFDKYNSYNAGAKDFPYLQQLLETEAIQVNGRLLPGPNKLISVIQDDDDLRDYLSPDTAGLIHGDAHLDNLLVEDGVIYLIDPKGIDPYPLEYDQGRFLWSMTGWNAIVRGEFELVEVGTGYHLDVRRRQQYMDGMPRFRAYFTDRQYHRMMYSAIVQYLTRIHHVAAEQETKALYIRGLQLAADLFEDLGRPLPLPENASTLR
ncbi:MAG TPA: phosphotransferase [Candidatus Saccharimonadales bacterium]|nr:phosphotransferase [Candidatus Saccharimonadales bacterium]